MATEHKKQQEQDKQCKSKVDKAALEASKKLKGKQISENKIVRKDGKDCNS
jgi:hypothetical protein